MPVERCHARTTGFVSLVLQTKGIVVFAPRDLVVTIVKTVSYLTRLKSFFGFP